jgi:hypothetical protein
MFILQAYQTSRTSYQQTSQQTEGHSFGDYLISGSVTVTSSTVIGASIVLCCVSLEHACALNTRYIQASVIQTTLRTRTKNSTAISAHRFNRPDTVHICKNTEYISYSWVLPIRSAVWNKICIWYVQFSDQYLKPLLLTILMSSLSYYFYRIFTSIWFSIRFSTRSLSTLVYIYIYIGYWLKRVIKTQNRVQYKLLSHCMA